LAKIGKNVEKNTNTIFKVKRFTGLNQTKIRQSKRHQILSGRYNSKNPENL